MISRTALILVFVSALTAISCSSGSKKSASTASAATPVVPARVSEEMILQKYSIAELNGAANALKVVVDASGENSAADKGQDIFGCAMTGDKALSMTMPLKALIDRQVRAETANYEADSKAYASTQGFETCGNSCSCGVLSDIVDSANTRSFTPAAAALHKRNKTKLAAKASRQSVDASLTCARKQTWFCDSDLKAYIEKQAN